MINPADIDLDALPWLPLEEQSSPLRKPAVYFAIAPSGEVLYIGLSRNPAQRWVGHHRYDQLEAVGGVRVAYLRVEESELLDVERLCIQHFDPPFNVLDSPKQAEIERLKAEVKKLEQEKVLLNSKNLELRSIHLDTEKELRHQRLENAALKAEKDRQTLPAPDPEKLWKTPIQEARMEIVNFTTRLCRDLSSLNAYATYQGLDVVIDFWIDAIPDKEKPEGRYRFFEITDTASVSALGKWDGLASVDTKDEVLQALTELAFVSNELKNRDQKRLEARFKHQEAITNKFAQEKDIPIKTKFVGLREKGLYPAVWEIDHEGDHPRHLLWKLGNLFGHGYAKFCLTAIGEDWLAKKAQANALKQQTDN